MGKTTIWVSEMLLDDLKKSQKQYKEKEALLLSHLLEIEADDTIWTMWGLQDGISIDYIESPLKGGYRNTLEIEEVLKNNIEFGSRKRKALSQYKMRNESNEPLVETVKKLITSMDSYYEELLEFIKNHTTTLYRKKYYGEDIKESGQNDDQIRREEA